MKSNDSHALTFNDPVSTSMPNCSAFSIASLGDIRGAEPRQEHDDEERDA